MSSKESQAWNEMKNGYLAQVEQAFLFRKRENCSEKDDEAMTKIDITKCVGCGGCIDLCPVMAISMVNDVVTIDQELCTKCGICVKVCPVWAPYEP